MKNNLSSLVSSGALTFFLLFTFVSHPYQSKATTNVKTANTAALTDPNLLCRTGPKGNGECHEVNTLTCHDLSGCPTEHQDAIGTVE
jgi:hypothetical protein